MIHALLLAATAAASNAEATKRPTPEEIYTASEATISIPENFFRVFLKPDGTVAFGYTMPSLEEPSQATNVGWWNAVAKLRLLQKNDPDFLAAWRATKADPDLQTTGVTYKKWSSGTDEEKADARKSLQERTDQAVQKHQLLFLLESVPVDEQSVADLSAELRGTPLTPLPLFRYCPGATGNVSVNAKHPGIQRFNRMVEEPVTREQYRSAIAEFAKYLEDHPSAPVDARNAELEKLVDPILAKIK